MRHTHMIHRRRFHQRVLMGVAVASGAVRRGGAAAGDRPPIRTNTPGPAQHRVGDYDKQHFS
ncbi:MAG: hypothetical protein ACKOTB_13220, partial [Planctomycetia bacterium]